MCEVQRTMEKMIVSWGTERYSGQIQSFHPHENVLSSSFSFFLYKNIEHFYHPKEDGGSYEKSTFANNEKVKREQEVIGTNSSLTVKKSLQDPSSLPSLIDNDQQNDESLDSKLQNELESVNDILEESAGTYKNELAFKKELSSYKLSLEDYNKVIAIVKGKDKKSCRIRLALCLLYITGLRISSLLVLRGSDIESLLEHCKGKILQSKNSPAFHYVHIADLGLSLLKSRQFDFKSLMEGKDPNDYLFTAYDKKQDVRKADKALSRVQLNTDVNSILRKASQTIFNTRVRSHNFRYSYIQDMLDNMVPIESVQKIIGHKDIQTTAHYHESVINGNNAKQIIRNLEQTRKSSTKSHFREYTSVREEFSIPKKRPIV
uniref:Tyr recombinase domain-containing protein n=1 Tax=Klebsormidium flaccidum TaxID=3175 RepID=A0A0B5GSM8_KLEFL|nr:hypothetical protein [Klebsormidium flaccidum]